MLDFETFNEANEREALAELLYKFYNNRNTFKVSAVLLQNVEALLLVLNENRDTPDNDDYASAMNLLLEIAIKLKWRLLFDILETLCFWENLSEASHIESLELSIKIVRYLRAWNLKHPY